MKKLAHLEVLKRQWRGAGRASSPAQTSRPRLDARARRRTQAFGTLECLEERRLLAYTFSYDPVAHLATALGDSATTALVIAPIGGLLEHSVDGGAFDSDWGGFTVNAADTESVEIDLSTGEGSSLDLGTSVYAASLLNASFTLNAPSNTSNTVTIDDSAGTTLAAGGLAYTINTGDPGSPNYPITGPGIAFYEPIGITAGGITLKGSAVDGNVYNVLSTRADEPVNIVTGSTGNSTINVTNAGSVTGIASQLSVTSSGGTADLIVDASNDGQAAGDPVTISDTQITNLALAPIVYDSTLTTLTIFGPNNDQEQNSTNYTVTNTPAADTTLYTGNNGGTVDIEGTTGDLTIYNQGAYPINVGNAGSSSGVQGSVTVHGLTPTITVDDSADTTGRSFNLSGSAAGAVFSGFPTSEASLYYNPSEVQQLLVSAGTGSDTLTVDFRGGNPLPLGPVGPAFAPLINSDNLFFDGGNGGLGATDILRFLGDPAAEANFAFTRETYDANGPGLGEISLAYTDPVDGPILQTVGFQNLTPVQDSAVVTDYVLNLNAASHQVGLTNTTIVPGSTPAVLIADTSGANPPTFESAAVANKTNITINPTLLNADGFPAENEYLINNSIQPQGLSTLTINGGTTDDQFHVLAAPPGVTTNLVAGDGDDTFYVTGSGLGAGSVLNVSGGPSYDTLNVISSNASPVITPTPNTTVDGTIGSIGGAGTLNYTSIETINLTKPALAVSAATSATISATEAQAFTDRVVATFTNPTVPAGTVGDLNLSSTSFAATINWGDLTSSPGWVVSTGAGTYSILGSHTYVMAGKYTTSVVITSLGSTGSTTISGSNTTLNLTSLGSPTATFAASPTLNVTVAAAPLSALAVQVSGIEGNPLSTTPAGVVVATFTDSGTILDPTTTPAPYTATINWGDGTTTSSTQILSTGTPNGTVFSVYGNHTYLSVGTFPVTVTITKTPFINEPVPGARAVAISTATIADAPLTAVTPQPSVNPTAGAYFSGPIGLFVDTNPTPISLTQASQMFKISVDWGDGSPQSVGYLTASTAVTGGIQYTITGRHTYASSLYNGFPGPATPGPVNSTYPITIYVMDADGAAINLSNVANVTGLSVVVAGRLDPASDSGVSNTDGITNVNQPTFLGTANQANVRVSVYATPTGGGARILLGTTTSDTTGAWALTSGVALADGSYTITAIGVDAANQILSETATVTPNPIVIDTVGPKVTGLFFNRVQGQINVGYQDFGGVSNGGVGVNLSTIVDANNYRLTKAHQKRGYLLTAVSISPGTTTGTQNATLFINGGAYLRGGKYVFTIYSADGNNRSGLQDIAGNALDGEYYGYLPSGNNVRGGNFVATLNAIHKIIFAPGSVIGSSTPVSPPGTRPGRVIIRTINPSAIPHAKVAARFAARHSVLQAVRPKLHHS